MNPARALLWAEKHCDVHVLTDSMNLGVAGPWRSPGAWGGDEEDG